MDAVLQSHWLSAIDHANELQASSPGIRVASTGRDELLLIRNSSGPF
jgi:hypothetical protein